MRRPGHRLSLLRREERSGQNSMYRKTPFLPKVKKKCGGEGGRGDTHLLHAQQVLADGTVASLCWRAQQAPAHRVLVGSAAQVICSSPE